MASIKKNTTKVKPTIIPTNTNQTAAQEVTSAIAKQEGPRPKSHSMIH